MTKKQQQMFKALHDSDYCTLYDVYKSFSDAKRRAYDYCIYEMHRKNGFYFRITGANCNFFCCGFCIMTTINACIAGIIQGEILTTL